METGFNCELWIKDFVNDEYNIKQIPNYLHKCRALRELEGLKSISDAELIKQQLRKYADKKERELKKKIKKEVKHEK